MNAAVDRETAIRKYGSQPKGYPGMQTSPLRILFVVNNLVNRSGMVLHVQELAVELHRRGHLPFAYSPLRGVIVDELVRAGVPVLETLDSAQVPDVIHGHNHFSTVLALLRFPGVPAIATSHGLSWQNEPPPQFPRILRYVPVSSTIRDLVIETHRIPEDRVTRLSNWVDLTRFAPRAPLPARPSRALMFNGLPLFDHFPIVREACAATGKTVDVIGGRGSQRVMDPWRILGEYDVVFARGRCALESMAVGTAVIVCGPEGMGPLVTTRNYAELRAHNFGAGRLRQPVTLEDVGRELRAYDSGDAADVSRVLRSEAGLEHAADNHLALYRAVIDEHRHTLPDPHLEARLTADYLQKITAHHRVVRDEATLKLRDQRNASRKWAAKLHRDREALTARVGHMATDLAGLRSDVPHLERERDRALARLQGIERSTLFRWQRRLSGIRARFLRQGRESA